MHYSLLPRCKWRSPPLSFAPDANVLTTHCIAIISATHQARQRQQLLATHDGDDTISERKKRARVALRQSFNKLPQLYRKKKDARQNSSFIQSLTGEGRRSSQFRAAQLFLTHLLDEMGDQVEPLLLPSFLDAVCHTTKSVPSAAGEESNKQEPSVSTLSTTPPLSVQEVALTVWLYCGAVHGWGLLEHSEPLWTESRALDFTQPRQASCASQDSRTSEETAAGLRNQWPLYYGSPLGMQRGVLVSGAAQLCLQIPWLLRQRRRGVTDIVGWTAFSISHWLSLAVAAASTSVGGTPALVAAEILQLIRQHQMITLYVCALLLLFVVNSATVGVSFVESDLLMVYREQSAAGCIGLLDWCTNLPQMAVNAPGRAAVGERNVGLSCRRLLTLSGHRSASLETFSRPNATTIASCITQMAFVDSMVFREILFDVPTMQWAALNDRMEEAHRSVIALKTVSPLSVSPTEQQALSINRDAIVVRLELLQRLVRLLMHRVVSLITLSHPPHTPFNNHDVKLSFSSTQQQLQQFHGTLLRFSFSCGWSEQDMPPAYQRLIVANL